MLTVLILRFLRTTAAVLGAGCGNKTVGQLAAPGADMGGQRQGHGQYLATLQPTTLQPATLQPGTLQELPYDLLPCNLVSCNLLPCNLLP